MEGVVHSETFMAAQSYSENGILTYNFQHSFLFQHPLILSFLNTVSGIPIEEVVYISLSLHAILVALCATLLFKTLNTLLGNEKNIGAYLLPPLVSFSLVSFAYSERTEIALPLLFLLMCYIFDMKFSGREKAITVLLLVLGITFGSSTSILIVIPFFFLFSLFRRRTSYLVYGLIPLTYLISAGFSYIQGLRHYFVFSLEGFVNFLSEVLSGRLPERVYPWNRFTIPTAEDMYLASWTYLSVLLLCFVVTFLSVFILVKYRFYERSDLKPLFLAASVTLLFTLGVASFAYIGASVKLETTFSDVRTIAIVFPTLLLPFVLTSKQLLLRISRNKIILILIVVLIALASLRTFYEPYPKSRYDPINAIEDIRVDPTSIYSVGDFLRNFKSGGEIVFDYKTSKISKFLSSESFQKSLFTSTLTPASSIVFDINGLKLGSLHTSLEAYTEANNLTSTYQVIYNNGNVLVLQQK